ncbi:RecQ family ATP-dependent DNA helicase [Conexibacter sp. DBS9H8]|uniref:RecQ family ATP-dependent DNA helicase n=1 Tax=Conexibacter sp. DBS9H8 TaxID=2937801 RepID=UPI00200DDCAB|nr:RecQ family ATP-dependent DNA helicase [Conexibacter sp. DBS9H8]
MPSLITVEEFRSRATVLLGRADELTPARVDTDLAELRACWRDLDAGVRPEIADVVAALAALADSRRSDTEARRALQGLDGLQAPRVPVRRFEGPATPEALLAHFGLDAFRPGQRDAVAAALAGRDALVVMPTGGGKSLCYQLPGVASPRLTVVVSPLIALIADQYRRLVRDGHPAVMFASGMGEAALASARAQIADGSARIVFCSPERFASPSFTAALEHRGVDLFVVDEAHCLSEWGHDFRPDYLRLERVIARLGRPAVMAATATATEQVSEEIVRRLGLRDPVMIRSGFDRPNLSFDVIGVDGEGSRERRMALLAHGLADPAQRPAIVYAGTRREVEEVVDRLSAEGLTVVGYHAGMPAEQRAAAQHRFMSSDAEVVVATNAFGMGVDKADVRSVWHVTIPTSVEAYYQEAGRGGRDGRPARAVLLAGRADLGRLITFIRRDGLGPEAVEGFLDRLARDAVAAGGGPFVIDAPRADRDRVCLGIAERAGALAMDFTGGGRLSLTLRERTPQRRRAIVEICQTATERNWRAYAAVKEYASAEGRCRRRILLDHFSDASIATPDGRCCDVCDPDTIGLPDPASLPARKARRAGSGSGRGVGGGRSGSPEAVLSDADRELLARLRGWRMEAAEGKPAYTVAHNAVLEAIAAARPASATELGALSGIGPAFLERHAAAVLELVAAAD